MFVSLQEFFDNYRIQNGKQPNETTLNRGLMRLKREVRELESVFNIILGNALPTWAVDIYYETDEYVQYGTPTVFYKSLVSQNLGVEPGVTAGWESSWEVINIDFEDIRNLLPSKADVATTLAGYGITDAYTKTEADALHDGLVDNADYPTLGALQGYVELLNSDKTALKDVPVNPLGSLGDKKGDVAMDATWLYICVEDFTDNTSNIWQRIELPNFGPFVQWTHGDLWNADTFYYVGDYVEYDGDTYKALQDDFAAVEPLMYQAADGLTSWSDYWELVV